MRNGLVESARRHRQVLALAAAAGLAALASGCMVAAARPTAEAQRALAPTGTLRAGLASGSPHHLIRDPVSGEAKGVGYELGQELARHLGVTFEPVAYGSVPAVLEALKAGKVDVAFTNATAVRAIDMDFSQPYLLIDSGFLVPAGSGIRTMEGVDRAGVRIGVIRGSSSDGRFTRELKRAQLVRADSFDEGVALLATGKVELFATNKALLYEMSDRLPGSQVLEGRYAVERVSVAIPKGRDAGMPFVRRFVDEMAASGFVTAAARRAGVRGTAVQ